MHYRKWMILLIMAVIVAAGVGYMFGVPFAYIKSSEDIEDIWVEYQHEDIFLSKEQEDNLAAELKKIICPHKLGSDFPMQMDKNPLKISCTVNCKSCNIVLGRNSVIYEEGGFFSECRIQNGDAMAERIRKIIAVGD